MGGNKGNKGKGAWDYDPWNQGQQRGGGGGWNNQQGNGGGGGAQEANGVTVTVKADAPTPGEASNALQIVVDSSGGAMLGRRLAQEDCTAQEDENRRLRVLLAEKNAALAHALAQLEALRKKNGGQ